MREDRLKSHDLRWLYLRDILGKGGIPLETYDTLTDKRIDRLIKLQELRLKEQNKTMEERQKEQERKQKLATDRANRAITKKK